MHFLAKIPSINEIDSFLISQGLPAGKLIREKIQTILQELRQKKEWFSQDSITRQTILLYISDQVKELENTLIPVINATGTIIHTNLGRSVFSAEIFKTIIPLATSYTNLEYSLQTGKRGNRSSCVYHYLRTLTGAEDALIVNNNAAAVLLSLSTLAKRGEIIISRGELVEIGGSFRIPEVIELSGGNLREVGTTNRTRLSDYEKAINEQTTVLLKVHASNYQIMGFTQSVSINELSPLANQNRLVLMEDLGSGVLKPTPLPGADPTVRQSIKNGADIVTFSGDKIIGGPQTGIIVGKQEYISQMKKNPLYRTLRCDKITTLLLEQTLKTYLDDKEQELIPTQKMLHEPPESVQRRAKQILDFIQPKEFFIDLFPCHSTPGGGSMPGTKIPSWGIVLSSKKKSAQEILDQLRKNTPPIIGRIANNQVILDCRTILPSQVKTVVQAIKLILNV